jgi:hypothetical protein
MKAGKGIKCNGTCLQMEVGPKITKSTANVWVSLVLQVVRVLILLVMLIDIASDNPTGSQ